LEAAVVIIRLTCLDYKKLSVLKTLFPRVPIQAVVSYIQLVCGGTPDILDGDFEQ
jgi:hypothetical protein